MSMLRVRIVKRDSTIPEWVKLGMVGIFTKHMGKDSKYDAEVQFSRNRKELFYYHELRYLNGNPVLPPKPKPEPDPNIHPVIGRKVRIRKHCIYYHPKHYIAKVVDVDTKLKLLTVVDSSGCYLTLFVTECNFVKYNQPVSL